MNTVGKSPPKIRDKESDIPALFDSKIVSSKNNPGGTFPMFVEHDLSHSQNDLNTLDVKKADPSADKGG